MSTGWLSGSLEGDRALVRLLRHPPVQLLVAAGWMAEYLIQRGTHEVLADQLPRGLVQETGRLIAGSAEAQENLKQLLAGNRPQVRLDGGELAARGGCQLVSRSSCAS